MPGEFGSYVKAFRCSACGDVPKPGTPYTNNHRDEICRECGNTDIDEIVGRWRFSVNGGFISHLRDRDYYDYHFFEPKNSGTEEPVTTSSLLKRIEQLEKDLKRLKKEVRR